MTLLEIGKTAENRPILLLKVGFFLQRQSEKLQKDLQIYTTSQTLAQLKQELKT